MPVCEPRTDEFRGQLGVVDLVERFRIFNRLNSVPLQLLGNEQSAPRSLSSSLPTWHDAVEGQPYARWGMQPGNQRN